MSLQRFGGNETLDNKNVKNFGHIIVTRGGRFGEGRPCRSYEKKSRHTPMIQKYPPQPLNITY